MGNIYLDQRIQLGQRFAAITERAKSDLGNDKWMDSYARILEQPVQVRIEETKMIYPNGCIGKDHC